MSDANNQNENGQANPPQDANLAVKPKSRSLNPFGLGIYHLVVSVLLTLFIYMLWPNATPEDGKLVFEPYWYFFGAQIPINDEARLILLVLLCGALGSYIHSATSFVDFTGNNALKKSWLWWYIMRPFIGGTLALIFYFLIRGGFLSTGSDASNISIFGITALAGLVGMFHKKATDKLKEVFDSLFRSKEGGGDEARQDKLVSEMLVDKAMIPLGKIKSIKITADKNEDTITIEEIYLMYEGVVTRVPVLADNFTLKYIIHQSLLFQYIAQKNVESANNQVIFDIKQTYLKDFLGHTGIVEMVGQSIAFVKPTTTVADAKIAMESVKNCQDVFVTETGTPESPVMGWLTNIDITKNINS